VNFALLTANWRFGIINAAMPERMKSTVINSITVEPRNLSKLLSFIINTSVLICPLQLSSFPSQPEEYIMKNNRLVLNYLTVDVK
jgi:hypothetical protein